MSTTPEFSAWIVDQLKERDWSQAQLARRTGLAAAHISRVLNGSHNAGLDFYRGLAQAFHVPLWEVLYQAGEIPLPTHNDPEVSALDERLLQQPPETRQRILAAFHQFLDIASPPAVYPPAIIIGDQPSSSLQPDQIQDLDSVVVFAGSLSPDDRRRLLLMIETTWSADVDESLSASGSAGAAAA